jgi:endonuclease/exonuclease/phosphatase family metal-dependent hydrolase
MRKSILSGMKKIFSLTLLAVTLSLSSLAQEFKVMSYNIYHGENPSKPGTSNLEEIARMIIIEQPEVIALQEVDSMTLRSERIFGKKVDIIAELSRMTGYRGYFAKAMDYDEGAYGEGVLVKKRLSNETQGLPNPAGGEPRAAAWIQIELRSEERLFFGGSHFCHEFQENRFAQLKALTSYADSLKYPAFIAGDLNFTPESPEYDSIPSHWKDAALGFDPSSATYAGDSSAARIDYILVDSRYFAVTSYKVLNLPYSDHFPIMATLKVIKAFKSEE